jgi:hypothetical protein
VFPSAFQLDAVRDLTWLQFHEFVEFRGRNKRVSAPSSAAPCVRWARFNRSEHDDAIGKGAIGVSREARQWPTKFHAKKSVGEIDGTNLLELEKLECAAGERLPNQCRQALLYSSVIRRERIRKLDTLDFKNGTFDPEKLNELLAVRSDYKIV